MNNEKAMMAVKALYLKDPDNFLLIEIGANDGYCCDRMWDFVREHDPHAVMVEPTPDYFAALQENYKHLSNIKYENIALSDTETIATMTYIPREVIVSEKVRFRLEHSPHLWKEHWAQGLGSFYTDKNMLGDPNLSEFQVKIDVSTKTWDYILAKYNVSDYNNVVVQTDCEGHDVVLLQNFPFDRIKPKMYFSEIYGKTRYPPSHPRYGKEVGLYSQDDEDAAKEIFRKNGYSVYQFGDMLAVLNRGK